MLLYITAVLLLYKTNNKRMQHTCIYIYIYIYIYIHIYMSCNIFLIFHTVPIATSFLFFFLFTCNLDNLCKRNVLQHQGEYFANFVFLMIPECFFFSFVILFSLRLSTEMEEYFNEIEFYISKISLLL